MFTLSLIRHSLTSTHLKADRAHLEAGPPHVRVVAESRVAARVTLVRTGALVARVAAVGVANARLAARLAGHALILVDAGARV